MITETTKEILFLVDEAEERRKSMESALKKLQNEKRDRGFKLLRNQLLFNNVEVKPGLVLEHRRLDILRNSRIISDLNHQIIEQRNRFVRASRAIGETMHWTSMSEHRSRRDRRKAVELARESAKI
jgi:hypothetical protein